MTKKNLTATPAPAPQQKKLEVKDITASFQYKPEESAYEQAETAIKNMLFANNWGTHLTQVSISVNSGKGYFNRYRLLAMLGKGGYDGDLGNGGSSVIHTLHMGKKLIEKGGLLIGMADENGMETEDLIWIPKPPALDRALIDAILDEKFEATSKRHSIGRDCMTRYSFANKDKAEVLGITMRMNDGCVSSIEGLLEGKSAAELIALDWLKTA